MYINMYIWMNVYLSDWCATKVIQKDIKNIIKTKKLLEYTSYRCIFLFNYLLILFCYLIILIYFV